MSKFNVGDRVEYVNENNGALFGRRGTVSADDIGLCGGSYVHVMWDNGKCGYAFDWNLKTLKEQAEPTLSDLARRVNALETTARERLDYDGARLEEEKRMRRQAEAELADANWTIRNLKNTIARMEAEVQRACELWRRRDWMSDSWFNDVRSFLADNDAKLDKGAKK